MTDAQPWVRELPRWASKLSHRRAVGPRCPDLSVVHSRLPLLARSRLPVRRVSAAGHQVFPAPALSSTTPPPRLTAKLGSPASKAVRNVELACGRYMVREGTAPAAGGYIEASWGSYCAINLFGSTSSTERVSASIEFDIRIESEETRTYETGPPLAASSRTAESLRPVDHDPTAPAHMGLYLTPSTPDSLVEFVEVGLQGTGLSIEDCAIWRLWPLGPPQPLPEYIVAPTEYIYAAEPGAWRAANSW